MITLRLICIIIGCLALFVLLILAIYQVLGLYKTKDETLKYDYSNDYAIKQFNERERKIDYLGNKLMGSYMWGYSNTYDIDSDMYIGLFHRGLCQSIKQESIDGVDYVVAKVYDQTVRCKIPADTQ